MSTTALADERVTRYEAFVQADPNNALIWLNLGDLYHQCGRFEEAIASFEKCIALSPQTNAARSRLASVFITQHRFAEAERLLRALLQAGDTDTSLLYNLGLALFYQKQWSEAKHVFHDAIAAGLKHGDCFAYLARSLHYEGDMAGAIEQCQRWVELANDGDSQGYLALLHMDQGEMAQAVELAEKVLATSPNNSHAGVVAGTGAIEQQQMEAAAGYFGGILKREPNNARAWLGAGLVHLYQQEHAESIRCLKEAVRLMPDNSGTIVALGWAQLAHKELHAAEQTFRQALAVDRNFAESHGGLATALALQGKVDTAKAEIALAGRLDPRGFGAAFAQTVILKIQGQHDRAVNLLAHLLQQAPRSGGRTLIEEIDLFMRKNPPRQVPPANPH